MKKVKMLICFLALMMLFAFSNAGTSLAKTETPQPAMLRIVHAIQDIPAVDVFIDGNAVAESIKFKNVSEYVKIPEGERNIEIYTSGTRGKEDPIIGASLIVKGGKSYSVAAFNNLKNVELKLLTNDSLPAGGKSKLRIGNLSSQIQQLNVGPKGNAPLFSNLPFRHVSNYQELNEDTYEFVLTKAEDEREMFPVPSTTLNADKIYTLLIIGGKGEIETIMLTDN